jgi:hypothetical protein
MRNGIADLHRRAEVSQKANERLLNALARVDHSRSVEELTADMQKPVHWSSRKVRGLRPWVEDKQLLTAISQGDFLIDSFRNRDFQKALYASEAQPEVDQRRRSLSARSSACSEPMASSRKCLARIVTQSRKARTILLA